MAQRQDAVVADETAALALTSQQASPGRTLRRLMLRLRLPYLSVMAFLVVWEFGASFVDPILFPPPTDVVGAFAELLATGELVAAFMVSLLDLIMGFGLAAFVGIAIGTLIGKFRAAEEIVYPYVSFFMATPTIALIPLFIIWFGVGTTARTVVVFMSALWPIIIDTATGVKSTDRTLRQVSSAFCLSNGQYLRWLALPGALPHIFSGLRIGLGQAIVGMIVAQMTMQLAGLGGLVLSYGNAFQTAHLLAGVVTSSVFGVVTVAAMDLVQKRAFPWIDGQRGLRG